MSTHITSPTQCVDMYSKYGRADFVLCYQWKSVKVSMSHICHVFFNLNFSLFHWYHPALVYKLCMCAQLFIENHHSAWTKRSVIFSWSEKYSNYMCLFVYYQKSKIYKFMWEGFTIKMMRLYYRDITSDLMNNNYASHIVAHLKPLNANGCYVFMYRIFSILFFSL